MGCKMSVVMIWGQHHKTAWRAVSKRICTFMIVVAYEAKPRTRKRPYTAGGADGYARRCVRSRAAYAETVTTRPPGRQSCPQVRAQPSRVRRNSHNLAAGMPVVPADAYEAKPHANRQAYRLPMSAKSTSANAVVRVFGSKAVFARRIQTFARIC